MSNINTQADFPKVLVVDDRAENIFAIEKILKKLDAQLYKAESGNEALSLTLRNDFSVILLDVNMPGMDGFETAALMRENSDTEHVPIIFVTAINKDQKNVFKGYQTGAVDYIFKPFEPDILISKVSVFIELYKQKQHMQNLIDWLRQNQFKLEHSNQKLQDFAHVASHDLQEPLRKIETFSEFLISEFNTELTKEGKGYLNRMTGAVGRMRALINGLLEFSRATSSELNLTHIDLNTVIEGVMSDLEIKIKETGAKITIDNTLPTIQADELQVTQLFENIIHNGLKFTKEGTTPLIEISSSYIKDKGTYTIKIKDNGIGIDKKYHEQIFGIFKRLHNSDNFEGSGIGLAICQRIIDRHNGELTLESQTNKGSIFFLTLPAEQEVMQVIEEKIRWIQ